jgi:hypothetical protein
VTDPKRREKSGRRDPKPKQPIIADGFQIRRTPANPMLEMLRASETGETGQVSQTSLVGETSLVTDQTPVRSETSQIRQTSLVPETSQPAKTQQSSQISQTSQIRQTTQVDVDILRGLPEVAGYQQFSNRLYDHLLPLLSAYSQLVYLRLIRLSHGFGSPVCTVSYKKLGEKTGISEASAKRAVADLMAKGLIRKSGEIRGYQKEQGITLEVFIPEARMEQSKVSETRQIRGTRQLPETRQVRETPITHVLQQVSTDALSVYDVRRIVARHTEAHRGDPSYSRAHLRADVVATLIGDGHEIDEGLVDEAIGTERS